MLAGCLKAIFPEEAGQVKADFSFWMVIMLRRV
jgi:hypothetical protein